MPVPLGQLKLWLKKVINKLSQSCYSLRLPFCRFLLSTLQIQTNSYVLALTSGALLGATAALLLGRRVFRKRPEDKPEPLFI